MFEIDSFHTLTTSANNWSEKHINLDQDLDAFILLQSEDTIFAEFIENTIVDTLLDTVGTEKTYHDFWVALEQVNSLIQTWWQDRSDVPRVDVIIWILHKNTLLLSNIWAASAYLLKTNKELIEITDEDANTWEQKFGFISNGELNNGEMVFFSSKSLLSSLSESDILDCVANASNVTECNKNMQTIFASEASEEHMWVLWLLFNAYAVKTPEHILLTQAKKYIHTIWDMAVVKKALAYVMTQKNTYLKNDKNIKTGLLMAGIIVSLILLYSLFSTLISLGTNSVDTEWVKENITQAKTHLRLASENLSNEQLFHINIQEAQSIVSNLESDALFIDDVSKLNDDIRILQGQFNKVNTFETSVADSLYTGDISDAVTVIRNKLKTYIIKPKSILGPINLPDTKVEEYSFTSLEKDEEFIDVAAIGDNLYLLTNFSKIVQFSKNGYFSYSDVAGQQTWGNAKALESYGQNLYLLGKEDNQIYKHAKSGNLFQSWSPYLTKEDQSALGNLVSFSIDGGFYILKEDLSMVKLFASPKYRLESLSLNQLPNNYTFDASSDIQVKTRNDLKYVYMLGDNRVWVFQPNSNDYRNTQSLLYIGQIDGGSESIKDFYTHQDGEILILTENGLYTIHFEISDDRIILR